MRYLMFRYIGLLGVSVISEVRARLIVHVQTLSALV